ncbi:glycosyltransferase family 1 protein [Leptolyngbya ohadii]|uniref:glycosyltransferase family 1 protein n=1 Tax=Leptolyngbya ohadii TaxID=1962290 RepID=UPI000B59943C|nr:glycosyltransferase family 1 protein [Leptolyngbya ohadii]
MSNQRLNGQINGKHSSSVPDLVCLSHLRWDFVYQRPQHLLSRCASERRVFFIEEPIFTDENHWRLEVSRRECGVWVAVPYLPKGLAEEVSIAIQQGLIDDLLAEQEIHDYICWFYTPMMLPIVEHLTPSLVVYDCMDELSAFKGAPTALRQREERLFDMADLVFTGGQSLYEAKRDRHPQVYAFPSSIDAVHFNQARQPQDDLADQAEIPHSRCGFYGVVDERFDIELLDRVAQAKPEWHFVIIGPVVKIDPASLPRHANIHYLGGKSYAELPHYLAGWDVALLPFARNESTRFISPTKTPEYLAGGKPVVSTSIRDVVRPYGEQDLVQIADTPDEFIAAIEAAMQQSQNSQWRDRVDAFLSQTSWDRTWSTMSGLMQKTIARKRQQFNEELPLTGSSKPGKSSPVSATEKATETKALTQHFTERKS